LRAACGEALGALGRALEELAQVTGTDERLSEVERQVREAVRVLEGLQAQWPVIGRRGFATGSLPDM
jgi:hypothetical protein